jgi:hypothetical protein
MVNERAFSHKASIGYHFHQLPMHFPFWKWHVKQPPGRLSPSFGWSNPPKKVFGLPSPFLVSYIHLHPDFGRFENYVDWFNPRFDCYDHPSNSHRPCLQSAFRRFVCTKNGPSFIKF